MAGLSLTLDPTIRLILEPGFTTHLSCADAIGGTLPNDTPSARQLWTDPEFGTLMLKPLQLQDDWLDHAAQLPYTLLLGTDYVFNPTDISAGLIWTGFVGNGNNPWIFHAPATPATLGPTVPPGGFAAHYNLGDAFGVSETSGLVNFATPPGTERRPEGGDLELPSTANDLRRLGSTRRFLPNQGFFFRWWQPEPALGIHQNMYAFTLGQYLFLCRQGLLEVFRDVSQGGDRTAWALEWKGQMFSRSSDRESSFNPDSLFGEQTAGDTPGAERSLMVIPFRRRYVLIQSNADRHIVIRVNNTPKLLADKSDYDITRADSIDIWALTSVVGRFQIQQVAYSPGPATVNFPYVKIEYQPVDTPAVVVRSDAFHLSTVGQTLSNPAGYDFNRATYENDCPAPTDDASDQSRTFGLQVTLTASGDQLWTPQVYGVDVIAEPTFQDNPASPHVIPDSSVPSPPPAGLVQSAQVSMGLQPGEGQMTARVLDFGGTADYPLSGYYFRSELPVELEFNSDPLFVGFTDAIEARPLRLTAAPVEMTLRAVDRWLLLDETFLRPQRDYTGVGHITAVDTIVRQCGIDTGSMAFRENAEYPAGWADVNANKWDTALGTPIMSEENLEGESVLGWKPQIRERGSVFLKRIADYYSGWIMGFRANGNFFYLPYTYYTQPVVTFFAHAGGISSGIVPSAGAGLSVSVSAGSASVQGTSVTVPGGGITISGLTDNSLNYLYLKNDGTGTSNTTGTTPAGAIGIGTATTFSGAVASVDTSAASGRQLSTSPVFRNPVEHRTIPPSGNIVQVISFYQNEQTAFKSAPYVDYGSILNSDSPNFLSGRYKWQIVEVNGSFSCPALNAMAYIVFQNSRRRRLRTSFQADWVSPTLIGIGQVFALEGYGNYRLIQYRANYLKSNWETADFIGEKVELGYS